MLCVIILEGGTKNARSVCTVVVSSPYNLRSKINLFIIIVLFVHFQYPSCQVCHRRFHAYQLYCSMLPLCFRFAVLLSSSFVILNVFANLHQKHGKKTLLSSLKVIPNKTCKHTLITYIFPLIIFDNFYVCFS